MTVKTILTEKGRDVVTIAPTATLGDAVNILSRRRIGALVVLGADDRVVGILSERDVVRVISERGVAALGEPLAPAMTRKVETCVDDDTVGDIMERMTSGKFRHIPVMQEERLAGIVSIGDVVKHRLAEIEFEASALTDYIRTA